MADKSTQSSHEVRVRRIPQEMRKALQNVASNVGTSEANIIKSHLPAILNTYPESYRATPRKD